MKERVANSSARAAEGCPGSAPSTPSAPASSAPCRARRPQIRLHHPRCRRPGAAHQAMLEAENIDEKRWPARQFAGMLDNWKNRGLLPKDLTPAEASGFANGRAKKALTPTSRPASNPQRGRLSAILLLENIRLCSASSRMSSPTITAASATSRRRVPDSNGRAVSLAAPPRSGQAGRQKPMSASSATTTSRSMLARRRGRQHPALREGFPWRQGHPPRAQLSLDLQIS